MQVPVNFHPRDYQEKAIQALEAGVRYAFWCWARRGGKDFTAFNYAVRRMTEETMAVVLVWPTQKQGFDNFWTNTENDGMKTLDHIPESLIASKISSPTNMKITLKNGSTLTLLGATDPDKLRGANGKLYVFSEFVDLPPDILDVIIPIIEVNGGQIIVQSTPKIDGMAGGTFKMLFDRAEKLMKAGDTTQYASLVTAREYLSDETLERIRNNTVAKNGNDYWFRQEFLCDWGQASSTSYYGAVLQAIEERGQLGAYPYDATHPVFTAWDLGGGADSTAIVFFQYYGKRARIIDYYETPDIGDKAIVDVVLAKPYNYAWHFLPHDGARRDSDAEQRINKLHDLGLPNSSLLKREGVEEGVKRAVEELIKADVNAGTTEDLIRKLRLYKRKFNPLTGDYMGPEHKTESHAADAIKYMFKAIFEDFDEKTGEFFYSPANAQDEYESDLIAMPSYYRPSY